MVCEQDGTRLASSDDGGNRSSLNQGRPNRSVLEFARLRIRPVVEDSAVRSWWADSRPLGSLLSRSNPLSLKRLVERVLGSGVDLVELRRTSLAHPHLYRRHWVLQRVGLAGTILSFFSAFQFQFVSSSSHSFPSAANNGRVVNETSTLLIGISRPPKLPTVTTDLGTKLGTRLSNGVAIHHCRDGLLPLLAAIPIIANTDQMFLPLLA
jgi:hypothetical protein